MCDYSLENYRSRPARKGEQYVLQRFPSGTKGFVSPGDCNTAVCIAPDTRLRLSEISVEDWSLAGQRGLEDIGPVTEVTFIRRDRGPHHDAVRFANGAEVSLQWLPRGVKAMLIDPIDDAVEWERITADLAV